MWWLWQDLKCKGHFLAYYYNHLHSQTTNYVFCCLNHQEKGTDVNPKWSWQALSCLSHEHIEFLNKRGIRGKVYHVALIIHAYQRPQLLDSLSWETALLNLHSASISYQSEGLSLSNSGLHWLGRFVTYHTSRWYHLLKCRANQRHTPVSSLALTGDHR